jgi:hypothetical protein
MECKETMDDREAGGNVESAGCSGLPGEANVPWFLEVGLCGCWLGVIG